MATATDGALMTWLLSSGIEHLHSWSYGVLGWFSVFWAEMTEVLLTLIIHLIFGVCRMRCGVQWNHGAGGPSRHSLSGMLESWECRKTLALASIRLCGARNTQSLLTPASILSF